MNIESELSEMSVAALDLSEFVTVHPHTTVRETVTAMRTTNINCAVITDEDNALVGIFTDRDVLRKVVTNPKTWGEPISSLMTKNPTTVNAEDKAQTAIHMMEEGHFRNVPVKRADGALIGNLTHFSLIRFLADRFPEQTYNLPPSPDNYGSNRYGG